MSSEAEQAAKAFWDAEEARTAQRHDEQMALLELQRRHSEVCITHIGLANSDRRRAAWREYACAVIAADQEHSKQLSRDHVAATADAMLAEEEKRFGRLEQP